LQLAQLRQNKSVLVLLGLKGQDNLALQAEKTVNGYKKKNFMLFMYFMVNFYIAVNDYDFNTEQQL